MRSDAQERAWRDPERWRPLVGPAIASFAGLATGVLILLGVLQRS